MAGQKEDTQSPWWGRLGGSDCPRGAAAVSPAQRTQQRTNKLGGMRYQCGRLERDVDSTSSPRPLTMTYCLCKVALHPQIQPLGMLIARYLFPVVCHPVGEKKTEQVLSAVSDISHLSPGESTSFRTWIHYGFQQQCLMNWSPRNKQ